MTKRVFLTALLSATCLAALIAATGTAYRCLAANQSQQGQPPIAGFPQSEQFLQHLLRTSDVDGIRAHGWNLLQQLTQGGSPAWESEPNWKNKCDIDLSTLCPQPTSRESASLPKSNRGNQILYTIFYSLDAANWITANGLNNGANLQKMLQANDTQIFPPPPPTAIVVKEIWEGVNFSKGDTPPVVDIFDPYHPQADPNPSLPNKLADLTSWKTSLQIKTDVTGDLDANAQCQADYPTKETAGVTAPDSLPINCFYSKRSQGRCDSLAMFTPVLQTVSDHVLMPDKPCVLILVGVEIATREMANWTWTTYWWVNVCNADPSGKCTAPGTEGRDTSSLPQQFQHYAMGTMLTPDVVPPGRDHDLSVALYNPYFEGINRNGTATNCMSCHSEAVYIPNCLVGAPNCNPARNGVPNATVNVGKPSSPCSPSKIASTIVNCPLQTRFLWSLADNQNAPQNAPSFVAATPALLEMTLKRDKPSTSAAPPAAPIKP